MWCRLELGLSVQRTVLPELRPASKAYLERELDIVNAEERNKQKMSIDLGKRE